MDHKQHSKSIFEERIPAPRTDDTAHCVFHVVKTTYDSVVLGNIRQRQPPDSRSSSACARRKRSDPAGHTCLRFHWLNALRLNQCAPASQRIKTATYTAPFFFASDTNPRTSIPTPEADVPNTCCHEAELCENYPTFPI